MSEWQPIEFTEDEWRRATDLACILLENLGPQRAGKCEHCSEEKVLLPNYKMKYELAKALSCFRGTAAANITTTYGGRHDQFRG